MYNEFDDIILRSLEEDAPFGDITTDVTVAGDATASGVFRAKESGVLCGIDIARRTFELVGGEVAFVKKKADGDLLEKGDIVAEISGNAASIALHERLGFVEVGRMPQVGAKFGRWLDLNMLQLVLDDRPEPDAGS